MRATFRTLLHNFDVRSFLRARHDHAMSVVRWVVILVPMAAAVGTLCAAFLWSLDLATRTRFAYPWLLFLLPVAGFAVGLLYHFAGRSVEGGNNLIVEQIHAPGGGVPLRMAPLIFLGTVITHLFGGSAGREGTAVQLGGSLASAFGAMCRLDAPSVRVILMAGIAAGFGAVFGTPLAGAVFALEVLAVGRVQYGALVPCLVAAVVGDWTCQNWGILHTPYHIDFMADVAGPLPINPLTWVASALAGVIFGLVGLAFAEANHALGDVIKRKIPYPCSQSRARSGRRCGPGSSPERPYYRRHQRGRRVGRDPQHRPADLQHHRRARCGRLGADGHRREASRHRFGKIAPPSI